MFRDSALKWHYYIVRLIRNVGKNTHICDKKNRLQKRYIRMWYDIISSSKLKKSSIKIFVTDSNYILNSNPIAFLCHKF